MKPATETLAETRARVRVVCKSHHCGPLVGLAGRARARHRRGRRVFMGPTSPALVRGSWRDGSRCSHIPASCAERAPRPMGGRVSTTATFERRRSTGACGLAHVLELLPCTRSERVARPCPRGTRNRTSEVSSVCGVHRPCSQFSSACSSCSDCCAVVLTTYRSRRLPCVAGCRGCVGHVHVLLAHGGDGRPTRRRRVFACSFSAGLRLCCSGHGDLARSLVVGGALPLGAFGA